ncbi:MAG: helix-turn-helix domain-containing protein, partial [Clostridia bacterium]|nr:helix-turn-helix domain-containing protein [Clostridia bacterium]
MEQKETLAKNLIKYRKALGLTQLELAEKLSYTDKAVSKWERAEAAPDVFVLKSLADLYGITVDKLLTEDPQKPPKTAKNKGLKQLLIIAISSL